VTAEVTLSRSFLATPQATIIEELLALLAYQRLVRHGSNTGTDWAVYPGEESWHWRIREGQKHLGVALTPPGQADKSCDVIISFAS
jgi:hypothetical protein